MRIVYTFPILYVILLTFHTISLVNYWCQISWFVRSYACVSHAWMKFLWCSDYERGYLFNESIYVAVITLFSVLLFCVYLYFLILALRCTPLMGQIKTLRYSPSIECLIYCMLSGGTQCLTLLCYHSERNNNSFLE